MLFLATNPDMAMMTLYGVMPRAEMQFLLEQHTDSGQLLFGPAPSEPNAIFLLELMAVLASLRKMQPLLRDARVMLFIDNNAALHALVKGDSSVPMARWIVQECWSILAYTAARAWFERVPSSSNPADAPSRQLPLTLPSCLAAQWETGEQKAPRSPKTFATALPRA